MLRKGTDSNERSLIHQCREALKSDYRDYWVEIVWYETEQIKVHKLNWKLNGKKNKRYRNSNSEYKYYNKKIGINLYRREHDLEYYLKDKGIEPPVTPKGTVSYREYSGYKQLWENYNKVILQIARENINQSKKNKVEPIRLVIKASNIKGEPCKIDFICEEVKEHINI